jgi:hypothetical protein
MRAARSMTAMSATEMGSTPDSSCVTCACACMANACARARVCVCVRARSVDLSELVRTEADHIKNAEYDRPRRNEELHIVRALARARGRA